MSAPELRRTLGLWQVTVSGVGVILGAGVYALVGPAAARAGGGLWLSFVIAAAAAALTAYSYGRLAQRRPRDSPELQYTTLAFGPRVGFVAGWLMLVADLMAAGAVALGFGGYLAHLVDLPVVPGALLLLALTGLALHAGVASAVRLAMVLTFVEAAGLVMVIVLGLPHWGGADWHELPHGLSGVWMGAALIFFAYLGFDELGNFAEEMRAPERADTVLALMALTATANTVLLLVLAASRSLYGMAAAGRLPRALARVGQRAVPRTATFVALAVTLLVVLSGDLVQAAAMTDAAVLFSFALVNASLLRLARIRVDRVVPLAALGLSVALLWPVTIIGLLAALGLALLGVLLGHGGDRDDDVLTA
jgi:amino acid transporter